MYCISESQIDFILSDICARGIEMESLQQNLLDHICCAVEHGLEDGGDFERFYFAILPTFYKSDLREIEVETVNLLTNKYFYVMKKTMIFSGGISVSLLVIGIILKFLHLPGAAVLLVVGIGLLSFAFLPLLFALKIKENRENAVRAVAGFGTASAMLISLGVLFKIMHWPYANMLCMIALLVMIFLFIPVFFFSGIRNPITKINTIVTSIMMLTGCILVLVLVRSPAATKKQSIEETAYFVQNNEILQREKGLFRSGLQSQSAAAIYQLCESLKSYIIEKETGLKSLDANFQSKVALLGDTWSNAYFKDSPNEMQQLRNLELLVKAYNDDTNTLYLVPINNRMFQLQDRVQQMLNNLVQIQMIVLQNQREVLAMK